MHTNPIDRAASVFSVVLFTRSDLREQGLSRYDIDRAMRAGLLVRLRRDRYARCAPDDALVAAARIGGRLTCLTLLAMLGVFVLASDRVHVQLGRSSSRYHPGLARTCRVHWSRRPAGEHLHATTLEEAIRDALHCQGPRATVATLDSLLHQRLLTRDQLASLLADLPRRFGVLLDLVDASAESGPETFVRLMLRALGLSFETQVQIAGVGRVDFVVEGWLIIECDSRSFHEGWGKQQEDRRRDIAAAAAGFVTIRPLAADILSRPGEVQRAIADVVAAFRDSRVTRPQDRGIARSRGRRENGAQTGSRGHWS